MTRFLSIPIVIGASILWLGVIAWGYLWLLSYKEQPGAVGPTPPTIALPGSERPVLRMFAHPHCPCTKASLTELAWLRDRIRDQVDVEILFVRPSGMSEDWLHGERWQDATAMPGVHVETDDNGVLAKRHGAKTSGHVVLIDETGKVLFSGGITALRGHVGDSRGRQLLLPRLRKETTVYESSEVFGCPLLGLSE